MVQQTQSDGAALHGVAVSRYQAGDISGAKEACQSLLVHDPDDIRAGSLLAVILFNEGDGAGAVAQLEHSLSVAPDDVDSHFKLAQILAATTQKARARQHLTTVIALAPGHVDARLGLAQLLMQDGDVAAAESCFRQGLAAAPDHPALLAGLGRLLAEGDELAEAIEMLEQAAAFRPGDPAIHYNLAKALGERGRSEEAISHYETAATLRPDFDQALKNLGNLLLKEGAPQKAADAYARAFALRRRPGGKRHTPEQFETTSKSKLQHDIEQFGYLVERGILSPEEGESIIAPYRAALAALPLDEDPTAQSPLAPEDLAALAPTYNRAVHMDKGSALPGPAINPALDRAAIEADYDRNGPGYTYLDGLLAPEALEGLRRFCLDSCIWYEFRYPRGYLGAFIDDGFCCPLLLQVAAELPRALPGIFGDHRLRQLWAFKYDSELSGIPIHADFAAVNVNFWITPDDAQIDTDGGGLIIYDKEAPLDWDFSRYNNDEPAIRRFISESGAKSVNAPHRQNRAVIFNSNLFHETGAISFRPGYENRRINITMLYGDRC